MSEVRVTDPVTGAQKGQKPERYDLIPPHALDELARVYGYGASKYDDRNWEKGYDWGLSLAALHRHVKAFEKGEVVDPESGRRHLLHAAFHLLTLDTYEQFGLGTDTRSKLGQQPADPFETPLSYPDDQASSLTDLASDDRSSRSLTTTSATDVKRWDEAVIVTSDDVKRFEQGVSDAVKRASELQFVADHEYVGPK